MINNLTSTIYDCSIVILPKIENKVGNITPIQNEKDIPFSIKRVYYLYDIPGGESRGGHAHKTLEQIVVAATGSFDVLLDDGNNRKLVSLNRPYIGLHVVPGLWRELQNFSSGAICLVLASDIYNIEDYIRDYGQFIEFKKR